MTEKDKVIARLEALDNTTLGVFCKKITGKNPFVGSLVLPSEIRRNVLKNLKYLINSGQLKFEKVK